MNIYTKVRRMLTWACVFAFIGCNPARKVERAINTLNNNPDKAAQFCANKYPTKDTIIYRDSLVLDTLYDLTPVEVDTIYKSDTTIVTITSPAKTIVKTITKIKEITKEPTQKIEEQRQLYLACESRYQKLFVSWEQSEKQRKDWRERFFWILLVLAALLGYALRKPIMKLVSGISFGK